MICRLFAPGSEGRTRGRGGMTKKVLKEPKNTLEFHRAATIYTSAYVGIRQHTSAYVGIRRHTSEYLEPGIP